MLLCRYVAGSRFTIKRVAIPCLQEILREADGLSVIIYISIGSNMHASPEQLQPTYGVAAAILV